MSNFPQMSDEQLTELVERLTLHAARKMSRLLWRGIELSRGGAIPGGFEPGDFASAAILGVIDGSRLWDPDVQPDFLKFLRSVVDSKVNQLVEKVENRNSRRLARTDSSEEGYAAHDIAGRDPDPSEFVENCEAARQFRAKILIAIEGDDVAISVLECLDSGYTKPSEIADLLGLPISEINNAQKRLRRKVTKLQTIREGGRCG